MKSVVSENIYLSPSYSSLIVCESCVCAFYPMMLHPIKVTISFHDVNNTCLVLCYTNKMLSWLIDMKTIMTEKRYYCCCWSDDDYDFRRATS